MVIFFSKTGLFGLVRKMRTIYLTTSVHTRSRQQTTQPQLVAKDVVELLQ